MPSLCHAISYLRWPSDADRAPIYTKQQPSANHRSQSWNLLQQTKEPSARAWIGPGNPPGSSVCLSRHQSSSARMQGHRRAPSALPRVYFDACRSFVLWLVILGPLEHTRPLSARPFTSHLSLRPDVSNSRKPPWSSHPRTPGKFQQKYTLPSDPESSALSIQQ